MPKRTKLTEKGDTFSQLKGNNVITKYAVPTSPGRIFNVKHRKEHRKRTSLTDQASKASSSTNVRNIIVISDSESDSQIPKGEAARQKLRSQKQSTKMPVLKHSKKTAKDMRSGARLSTGGWTQTGDHVKDSRAVLTPPIQISDSPVSTKGSVEMRSSGTPYSEKSVRSWRRLKPGESTPSQSSPHTALHSTPNLVTSTSKVGAIMQSHFKGKPVAQSTVKSSKVNIRTPSKQTGLIMNSPRSPDPRKIVDKYTKMLNDQRNITPLKYGGESRSQKLFQSTHHKDKAGMTYPRLADTQEAHNDAEKGSHHKDKDIDGNLIPLAYQHLRDISGRRQLYGTRRICSSEAVRPSSASRDDKRRSGDRLFKSLGKPELQQRRESCDKLDKRTDCQTSEPKEIVKNKDDPAISQGTGLVKNPNIVKSRDLEGLSQGVGLKTTTSPNSNRGRQARGKRSVLDRAIAEFVTEMTTTTRKTSKVFTDVSNNKTMAEENHQEIGYKATKKGTVQSRSSSSNSVRSSPSFIPKRHKNHSVSSVTSGVTGVFSLEHRTPQKSDSENDPVCSKYKSADPDRHPMHSITPQSRKFSNKIEPLAHADPEERPTNSIMPQSRKLSNKIEPLAHADPEERPTNSITPQSRILLNKIEPLTQNHGDSSQKNEAKTSDSSEARAMISPVLTGKKRAIDENVQDKPSTKRTRNFIEVERDEKRMNTILDSVLSEAKKKSKEKRLGSFASRRSLFSSPTKRRSSLMADQDHPLNRMLKSYNKSQTDDGKLKNPKSTMTNNATNGSGVVETGPSGSKTSDVQNKPMEEPSKILHVEDITPEKANTTLNVLRVEKTPHRSDVTMEPSSPNVSISLRSNSQHGDECLKKLTAPTNLYKRSLKDSGTIASSQVENITPSELRSKVEEQTPKQKVSDVDLNAEPLISGSKVVKWPTDIKFPKLTLWPIFTVTLQNSVEDFKASRVTASGTVMSQSSTKEFNVSKVIASNSVASQSISNVTSMQKVENSTRVTSSVKSTECDPKSQGETYRDPKSRGETYRSSQNSESKVIDLTLVDDSDDSDVEIVAVMTPNTPLCHIVRKTQSIKTIMLTPRAQSPQPILEADKLQGLMGTGSKQRVCLTEDLTPTATTGPTTDGGTVPVPQSSPDISVEQDPVPSNLDTPKPRGEDIAKDLTPTAQHNPDPKACQGSATDGGTVPRVPVPQANPDFSVEQDPVSSNLDTSKPRGEDLTQSSKDKPNDNGSRSDQPTCAEQVETKKISLQKASTSSEAINELSSSEQRQASTFSKIEITSQIKIVEDVDDGVLSDVPASISSPGTSKPPSETTCLDGAELDDTEIYSIPDMDITTDHEAAVNDMSATGHDMGATDHGEAVSVTGHDMDATGHDMDATGHDMDTTDHGAAVIDITATGYDMDVTDHAAAVIDISATSHGMDTTDHEASVIGISATGHDMDTTDHEVAVTGISAAGHDMGVTDHGTAITGVSAAGHDMDTTDHEAAITDITAVGHDEGATEECSNQNTDTNEAIPCTSNTKNLQGNIFEVIQYDIPETGDETTSGTLIQDSDTTSKMSTAESNSPAPERDSEATTCLPSSDDLASSSTDLENVRTAQSSEAEKQDSNSSFSVHATSKETTQGSKSTETGIQGSKVDDIKDFETSMFDISQFFDDDDSTLGQLSDAEFEMNDYLPEVLREDTLSALRQNRSDSTGDAESTMNEDLIDELPDLTQTPRAKRRRFTDKDSGQKTTVAQREKMMSRLLEKTFTTRQSLPPESVVDSDWIKELDEVISSKPRRTRNSRKRLRSTDQLSTLKVEPTFTEILADTSFSRSYRVHGAALKKLVREKKRESEVDKMEEILLSDLKKGGFRKTLEQAAHGGQASHMECDEDTKRAINLMKKDWGTLPILPFSGGIFKSKSLRYCEHKMELKSCFDAASLEGLAAGTRNVVLRLSAADITYQRSYLNFLLNQPNTRTQTYKWLLDALHCYRKCEDVQDIIQSNLRLRKFYQSPFSYTQFKSAFIDAGVSTSLFNNDHDPQRTQQLVPEYSVCEKCSRRRQKNSARHVVSMAKILSTVSHLYIGYLSESEKIETAVFLLLLLQERNIRGIDVMEIVGMLLKELINWKSEKYLIVRRLLEVSTRLNTLRSIAMRLHFNGERPHELSRILAFALLKLHVFGDEPQTAKFDNFNDLEALVDIVDHFNPDNLELLLVPEESEGQIGSQKRSYYHLSLLLPLLNICIGNKCEDEATFVVLDRIWSILRSMNKSIRDNGAIYRSQVKYELSLFTKHLRILIQKAPKKNKASIFKYLRSAPVKEEMVNTSVCESDSSSESSDEVQVAYDDDNEEVKGQVPRSSRMVTEIDEFRIAQAIKNRIIGSVGKD